MPESVTSTALAKEWEQIQAAQTDTAAFRPLYDKYFSAIFSFIYARINDESVSADVCSQVFLKAMQNLQKYQFRGLPFSAWLYRIASNEVAQFFRDQTKTRFIVAENEQMQQLADEMESTDDIDWYAILPTALEALKPKEVRLIEMRFFEQLSFKEIADILDITESNAKVRTYRILDRLKTILENYQRPLS